MNYVMMGYMGAGKSTVGKALSRKLKLNYIDTDEMIVKQMNLSISEIFDQYGEEYFRNLETELIKKLSEEVDNSVISLGGGLAVKEENHQYIKNAGKVVYLRVKPETVFNRLKGDTTRPLLQGSTEEVMNKIKDMISKRGPIYEKLSDVTVDVDDLNVSKIVNLV